MSFRIMFDAAVPLNIPRHLLTGTTVIAGYDTGSPGRAWKGHFGDFPGHQMVHVDQGASGAPVHSANVMDIEPQAYSPGQVADWMKACTAPRPTAYCDRTDYPHVRALWKGDIWLAAPDLRFSSLELLQASWPGVIAVQDTFAGPYDASTIYDAHWPALPPATIPPAPAGFSVTGHNELASFGWGPDAADPAIHSQLEVRREPSHVLVINELIAGTHARLPLSAGEYSARVRYAGGTWTSWHGFQVFPA